LGVCDDIEVLTKELVVGFGSILHSPSPFLAKNHYKAYSKLTGFPKEKYLSKHFTTLPILNRRDIPKYLKLFAFVIVRKINRYKITAYKRNEYQ